MESTRICSFPDCGREHSAKGLCAAHHKQKCKGRTLKPIQDRSYLKLPLVEKVLRRVDMSGECWVWTGSTSVGYGNIRHGGKLHLVHRVVYESVHGGIPDGHYVDHKCHNPACVNPEHLQAVTPKENGENRAGVPSNNTSGARGVFYDKRRARWYGQVGDAGKTYSTKSFVDKADAEAAVIELRLKVHTNNLLDRAA